VVGKVVATLRSKISNGSKLLPGIDGRSLWARRFRDVLASFVSDAGGADMVSEAERTILRRSATLVVELEMLESQFAEGHGADPADLDLYARVSGTLTRLLERVGLERRQRDVSPTLEDVVAEIVAEKELAARRAAEAADVALPLESEPTAAAGAPEAGVA
jgi:hypothetical protein